MEIAVIKQPVESYFMSCSLSGRIIRTWEWNNKPEISGSKTGIIAFLEWKLKHNTYSTGDTDWILN